MAASSLKQPITRLIGHSHPTKPRANGADKLRKPNFPNGVSAKTVELVTPENLIKHTPLFAELTGEEQQIISNRLQPQNFQPDEALFAQDSPSEVLYLIQEGWVKLYADDTSLVATLGPGRLLGETDFFLGRVHANTALAASKVTAWQLGTNALSGIIAQYPQVGLSLGLAFGTGISQFQDYLAKALAKISLLQNLSSGERQAVAHHLSPQRYLPRETIYRSGDPPTGIFFIEQGQVWLLSQGQDCAELWPGQTFGEQAVILDRPHTYTAQAETEVIAWQLSPADFATLAETYPSLKRAFSQNLHARFAEALAIASLMVKVEIQALGVACGQHNELVNRLQQVDQTLTWLKDNQMLF
ncbi:MAG: cyclic nucleotide-binding domain-containing protein [Anaerolineae bacterium]|nr:cyclic nucleotide-binding domain-containing protein [Anaerolineae bacterium]